jgi:hypothetical protein
MRVKAFLMVRTIPNRSRRERRRCVTGTMKGTTGNRVISSYGREGWQPRVDWRRDACGTDGCDRRRHVGAALLRARYFPAAGVASGFPFSTMYVASTRADAALLFVAL